MKKEQFSVLNSVFVNVLVSLRTNDKYLDHSVYKDSIECMGFWVAVEIDIKDLVLFVKSADHPCTLLKSKNFRLKIPFHGLKHFQN